jgi:hypothetical protein
MTREELLNSEGNVYQLKHGNRVAYYAPSDIFPDGSILGYEVDKTGFPRCSKYGLVHEYPFNASDVIKILPIIATKWR